MSQPLPFVDINPASAVKATVIWLHGLGDSGHGFAPIVPELKLPEDMAIRFVFPHAPERPVTINGGMRMRAWYDIKSMDFENRADLGGVRESAKLVEQLIEDEIAKGVPAHRIILAGFSQGGVIALHLGTRYAKTLAGILALSTYMCEPGLLAEEATDANKHTPIQFGHGTHDDVVPVAMGQAACQALKDAGYDAKWKTYAMQHNVCMEEINDISAWMQARLS